jgi:hypothetical protein
MLSLTLFGREDKMSEDVIRRYNGARPIQAPAQLLADAIREVEVLREENARLREALKPFADAAEGFRDEVSDEYPFQFGDFRLGQCRAAAAAIREGAENA